MYGCGGLYRKNTLELLFHVDTKKGGSLWCLGFTDILVGFIVLFVGLVVPLFVSCYLVYGKKIFWGVFTWFSV